MTNIKEARDNFINFLNSCEHGVAVELLKSIGIKEHESAGDRLPNGLTEQTTYYCRLVDNDGDVDYAITLAFSVRVRDVSGDEPELIEVVGWEWWG
jgi:ABC-type antimicrobial peptide transport system ATPase subunit